MTIPSKEIQNPQPVKRPTFYWVVLIPIGLLNASLFALSTLIAFYVAHDLYIGASCDFWSCPTPSDFLLFTIIALLQMPGLVALYHILTGSEDRRGIIEFEYLLLIFFSILTIIGPILGIIVISYLRSPTFNEYMKFKVGDTKALNQYYWF